MLFTSNAQRASVCRTLLEWNGLPSLWGGFELSDRARLLASGDQAPSSPREAVFAQIAVALWDGRGELRFGDLLPLLDAEGRASLDALLEALTGGADALAEWVEAHNADGFEFSEPSSALLRAAV